MRELPITIIDAFAGGNVYLDSVTGQKVPGSPSIILRSMEAAAEKLKGERKNSFNLDGQYFFIEKNHDTFEVLSKSIKESKYKYMIEYRVFLVEDDFNNQWESLIELIRRRKGSGRSLFILDQCGYSDVPFPAIHTILSSLDKSEIILTFAADFLLDYLRCNEKKCHDLSKIGLSLPTSSMSIGGSNDEERRIIQLALHQEMKNKSGDKYYTPFFICCRDSNKAYWFVHLSNHFKAKDVMVQLHWRYNNCFAHYGGSGLQMLGYDPKMDSSLTKQPLLESFFFDEKAKRSTLDALYQDLPVLLRNSYSEGVDFQNLFSAISNETPAPMSLLKEALRDLAADGIISVRSATGLTSRRKGVQKNADLIIMEKQKRFFTF